MHLEAIYCGSFLNASPGHVFMPNTVRKLNKKFNYYSLISNGNNFENSNSS